MARLPLFVKAAFALSSAAAVFVAINGQYINQNAKHYISQLKSKFKKNKYYRRYMTEKENKLAISQYVQFKSLPHPTIQSKKSLQKLKRYLIHKKLVPTNVDFLIESLHDFQADQLSRLISPEVAIRLAVSSHSTNRRVVNLIYKGMPHASINEKDKRHDTYLNKLLSKVPENKEECLLFIKNGGLDHLLLHCNKHRDSLKFIIPISYHVPDQHIFYHTGWIRKLCEITLDSSAAYIQQKIDGLACLENLRSEQGQFIDRMVLPLYIPDETNSPVVDMIFIHGLWGSCYHTWRQDSCLEVDYADGNKSTLSKIARYVSNNSLKISNRTSCWPRDWLARDICGSVRILAVNYKSDQVESLENLVELVRQRLLHCGVGQRPIIWVGHSMGGLLVKHLSVQSEFSQSSIGFIFYSVPHHGSPLINEFLANMFPVLRQISPVNNTYLNQIHYNWLQSLEAENTVLSFVENQPLRIPHLSIERIIVDEYSAFPGIGRFYNMLNKNHVNVCKPLSKSGVDYKIVTDFINELIIDTVKRSHKSTLLEKIVGQQCPLGSEVSDFF